MGVGTCLLSNEPSVLKDKMIQARLDGKTWKQIQEEFGFSSVQVARKTFRKVTGINNLNVKGKELKHMLDNNMFDELKMAVPKAPPAPAAAAETATAEAATAAPVSAPGSGTGMVGEHFDILHKAFPNEPNKVLLMNADEEELYSLYSGAAQGQKAKKSFIEIEDQYGSAKVDQAWNMLKGGSYYSDIKTATGLDFADIDGIFWHKQLGKEFTDSTYGKYIWEAYKKKPTSEYGFKAVQDHVWNLKKMGVDPSDIAKLTGVDEKVVGMILDNSWSLPAKGAKQYVGFPSPSYSSPSASYSQVSSQLVGESNKFSNMSKAQVDSWIQSLGQDMTSDQLSYFRSYTGSFYTEVNSALRSGSYVSTNSRGAKAAREMKAAMKPFPEDVTLHRGVGREAFPLGPPSPGDAYMDQGFMSTSFGDSAAFGSKTYQLHMDIPAGSSAKGRPIYNISGFGMSEREILLDASIDWVVTGVKQIGSQTHVYLRAV